MEDELHPDRIGRIGEREFEVLCERARLYCNKSAVDMMGWDFIVEFPMAPAGQHLTLDQRPTNAARVQLKSTLGRSGNRIRLSLSAIDRLAKDPRPAIIIVFRMRDDGELQSGYIVHLIGNELARVLRRLRAAEARKALDINHADISYDYQKVGKRFEPTADGLRAALLSACSGNPAAYTVEKQRQLAELGYENGQFEAEALLWIEGPQHLNNLLLGLVPLKPHKLRVFDSRFGIRLPYRGTLFDDIEEIRLTPPTLGPCEVSVRGSGLVSAARFDAEMFIGPPLPGMDGPELLVRHADFIIRLTSGGLNFETVGAIQDIRRTLDQWAELIRALALMATGGATMTISGNRRIPAFSLPVDQPITGPYLDELPVISQFLDGWQRLLTGAGLRSNADIEFDSFWEANDARIAVDMLLNPKPLARFEFQSLDAADLPDPIEGLYFNRCSFVDVALAYSVKMIFEQTDDVIWRFRSRRFEALDVRPDVADLDEYGIDQAAAHGLTLIIHPNNITMEQDPDTTESSIAPCEDSANCQ